MMRLTHLANVSKKNGTFKDIQSKNTVRSAIPSCWVVTENEVQRVSAFLNVKIDTLLFPLNPKEKDPNGAFGPLI